MTTQDRICLVCMVFSSVTDESQVAMAMNYATLMTKYIDTDDLDLFIDILSIASTKMSNRLNIEI
ncbi:MAG: hypothetical protein KAS32_27730 [Candidatus Peribacteraceae bacterium]|nr:hypothetical protein [Candidatus Peribacteraceae bacterium]